MLSKALLFIGLLTTGLAMGLTLTHVLQAPGSAGLGGAEWLAVQHTFYGGFAIVGGIAEVLGLLAAVFLAIANFVHKRIAVAGASVVAALCLLGTLLAYFFGNAPVNAKVASWTVSTLPHDWSAYRAQWEAAHAISAGLSATAFIVLGITAVAAITWRPRVDLGAADATSRS